MLPAQDTRGKGLSLARRLYRSRTLGLALGFFCVAAGMAPLQPAPWVWGFMLFNAFAWPHLAYQWARLARVPFRAEYRNLLVDSLLGGFWVGAMHFNPLPLATTLGMMAMNNMALGGLRFFLAGSAAQVLGMGVALWLFGPAFVAQTTPEQLYACLPMLTLYPLALGYICYQQAVTLGRHKRELLALSRTDSLTGLLNHGAWKDQLEIEFQRCKRQAHGGAIALIDIDHFKAINDTYGHVAGDVVLRQLSKLLRQNLRVSDQAGRYGGDEFCVILPDVPLAHAAELMEALRGRFGALGYEQSPALQVSLSIGLAAFNPLHDDAMGWLNDADQALYAAKTCGRNNVTCHPPEQPSRRLLNSL
ncbi:diguanylate cyclase [Pseudomonas protegens]|uniref:diguanylate cyclase n=1 Tax=Pseudomonas protegens TaxID=380021 RepID=UPI001B318DAA|nr:diguanylate cyclase [Pseudomonas protegens]MBP5104540.1 diguanylate cyclase [Pseudomonas protegens]MBP5132831.1 diguanylate cyclase [Pseudomonas protegens]MBP5148342.1 diguanylate cyclase [Pseudomonas protegens]MDS9879119.1 diguanylate cyclase [Pseudomonas protegens]